jgi:hypothetical protein
MSAVAVREVMRRMLDSAEFVELFRADPAAAMEPFELTGEEAAALQAINPAEITAEDRDLAQKMDMNEVTVFTP